MLSGNFNNQPNGSLKKMCFLRALDLSELKVLVKLFSEEVLFEMHPVFERNDSGTTTMPQASIVWLGDQESRPTYIGQVRTLLILSFIKSISFNFKVNVTPNLVLFIEVNSSFLQIEVMDFVIIWRNI